MENKAIKYIIRLEKVLAAKPYPNKYPIIINPLLNFAFSSIVNKIEITNIINPISVTNIVNFFHCGWKRETLPIEFIKVVLNL